MLLVKQMTLIKTQMHFSQFRNMREKCLSDNFCEMNGIYIFFVIQNLNFSFFLVENQYALIPKTWCKALSRELVAQYY